jgi:ankyrin repeat protein
MELLKHNPDVNVCLPDGTNALTVALSHKDTELVKALLDYPGIITEPTQNTFVVRILVSLAFFANHFTQYDAILRSNGARICTTLQNLVPRIS